MEEELCTISLKNISFNKEQPRKTFNQKELEELAESIKSIGLIQPPIVMPQDPLSKTYELIAGERRVRAALLAGLDKISVIVRKHSSLDKARASLIENIQRQDLNPIEIASFIRTIMVQFELKQEEVASKIGKKRSTIANYIRLLSLPDSIQESLKSNRISMGHAKVILSLQESFHQFLLHENIINDSLTVREAEKYAENITTKKTKEKPKKDIHLEDIAKTLQDALGTKVGLISQGKQRGRIVIHYNDYDDLDRLLEVLKA